MTTSVLDQDVQATTPTGPSLYPASLRATATHLEQLCRELEAMTDAAWTQALMWDEVLGELVPAGEVLGAPKEDRRPPEWAERWMRRAWTERQALTFQESPLIPDPDSPERARAFVALPLGGEGLLYLEEAWLGADPKGNDRAELAASARRWSESVTASRQERRSLLAQRIRDQVGDAVYDLLPEEGRNDPWPWTADRLAQVLEADVVVFRFADGGLVSSTGADPARLGALGDFLASRPGETTRTTPILAARTRNRDGEAVRRLGVLSFLGWARGDGQDRVALGAFRFASPSADEFEPEHLTVTRKLLALATALGQEP